MGHPEPKPDLPSEPAVGGKLPHTRDIVSEHLQTTPEIHLQSTLNLQQPPGGKPNFHLVQNYFLFSPVGFSFKGNLSLLDLLFFPGDQKAIGGDQSRGAVLLGQRQERLGRFVGGEEARRALEDQPPKRALQEGCSGGFWGGDRLLAVFFFFFFLFFMLLAVVFR